MSNLRLVSTLVEALCILKLNCQPPSIYNSTVFVLFGLKSKLSIRVGKYAIGTSILGFDCLLVGMICVMDDGIMTAYVHYLLVNPEYQKRNIGKTLVDMVKEKYADYLRLSLIAYESGIRFYENCGFKKADGESPMFITNLTD